MKDFKCHTFDPERAAEWEKMFGAATVFVKSPLPQWASLPGHPKSLIYELDLALLADEQKERLITFLAEKFNLSKDDVRADIEKAGVPILADHCIVTVENLQRWLT